MVPSLSYFSLYFPFLCSLSFPVGCLLSPSMSYCCSFLSCSNGTPGPGPGKHLCGASVMLSEPYENWHLCYQAFQAKAECWSTSPNSQHFPTLIARSTFTSCMQIPLNLATFSFNFLSHLPNLTPKKPATCFAPLVGSLPFVRGSRNGHPLTFQLTSVIISFPFPVALFVLCFPVLHIHLPPLVPFVQPRFPLPTVSSIQPRFPLPIVPSVQPLFPLPTIAYHTSIGGSLLFRYIFSGFPQDCSFLPFT